MTEEIIFGGGCFWCTEAIFQNLLGVISVESGYSGGKVTNPTYEQVSSGSTGHAEAIKIIFDPNIIGLDKLLAVFFSTHDPTTKNRQGNDVGEQYRSTIFYFNDTQKTAILNFLAILKADQVFTNDIVTEVLPFKNFYPAEDYHRDYYINNRNAPYCQVVIDPKIKKLREKFSALLKK